MLDRKAPNYKKQRATKSQKVTKFRVTISTKFSNSPQLFDEFYSCFIQTDLFQIISLFFHFFLWKNLLVVSPHQEKRFMTTSHNSKKIICYGKILCKTNGGKKMAGRHDCQNGVMKQNIRKNMNNSFQLLNIWFSCRPFHVVTVQTKRS